jgi:hypothetical protein
VCAGGEKGEEIKRMYVQQGFPNVSIVYPKTRQDKSSNDNNVNVCMHPKLAFLLFEGKLIGGDFVWCVWGKDV